MERLLRPFARVTSGGRFVPEIDGLRTVAIGFVLLFHLGVDLSAMSPAWTIPADGLARHVVLFGFRGVEFFFVISGFVLGLPFAAHYLTGAPRVPLRAYFLRRITRLEPPYILALLGAFTLHVLARGRSAAALLPHLAAGLVYQHNLVFGEENPILNIAWSLEVEIQFYLLVPLLSQVFAIRSALLRRAVLLGGMLVCALLVSAWVVPESRAGISILRFLQFFLGGFLVVDLYLVDWKQRPARAFAFDALTLAVFPLLLWTFVHFGPPRTSEPLAPLLALTVGIPLFYIAAFRGTITSAVLRNPWITTFGGMCYTTYLLHNLALWPVLSATRVLQPSGRWAVNLALQAALATPAILIPCAAFFLLVEKPCMDRAWPQRLWARFRS